MGQEEGSLTVPNLVIHRQGDAYYLNDKDAKRVDASLIAVLVKALTAPANPELSLDDLGVTPALLKANASSVAHHFAETRVVNGHPVHEAMLESSFADPATMENGGGLGSGLVCARLGRYLMFFSTLIVIDSG
jgi:hypothetical protein